MYFPAILSTLTLFLLISKNALAVTAAPLLQSASDSSGLQTYGSASVGPRSSIKEVLVKRGRSRVPKATSTAKRWKWKASDLKSWNYRNTALAHNNGAYVKTGSGKKVKWKKGANGDAGKQFNYVCIILFQPNGSQNISSSRDPILKTH